MLFTVLNPIIGFFVYCAVMPIYLLIFAMGTIKVKRTILTLKLKKWLGRVSYSKLGLVSRKSRITDVLQVSTDEEIDFQANRSMAYLYRISFWTPRELAKTAQRQQTIDLISDKQLAYVILSTVFAHSVCWDEERQMYRLKMEGFEDLYLFEGFYWDARHVLVSPDGSKIIIQMDNGKEYSSDATDSLCKANYNLAKLHVQVCLSYFAPGLSHNHVHFVFPSAMCILSKQLLNHKGSLYRLLSPHFRFTERINYQALRVGKATNNKRSQLDRLFFLWQPFPITKEQFMEGVARKCKVHYIDHGSENCDEMKSEKKKTISNGVTPDEISSKVASNDWLHRPLAECKDQNLNNCRRRHTLFPPEYITDEKLSKIPYLAFLREYYMVVKRYVQEMEPFIDRKEWQMLSDAVKKHVPLFDRVDMVEAIATFIHQVGVVHFCDHNSYLTYFAYRYGSMAIRTPFESFTDEEHWKDASKEHNFNVAAVRNNPLLLIRQRDVMRTRCFLNLFVDYIPNPDCNLQLIDTDYQFENPGAKQAAINFKSQLRTLDKNLTNTESPLKIELGNERDIRAKGLQITKLENIVRTVCF